jgi:hypothetical protein
MCEDREDRFERALWELYRSAAEAKQFRPPVVAPKEHQLLGEVLDLVTDIREHKRTAA